MNLDAFKKTRFMLPKEYLPLHFRPKLKMKSANASFCPYMWLLGKEIILPKFNHIIN